MYICLKTIRHNTTVKSNMGLFVVYPIKQNFNKLCIYFRRNKVIQKEAIFVIILEVPMISVIIYLEKSNAAQNTFRSWLAGSLLIVGGGGGGGHKGPIDDCPCCNYRPADNLRALASGKWA